jgi:hypothetical protein
VKTVAGEEVEVLGLDPDCPGWAFVRFVGLGHEARAQTAWLKEDDVDSRERAIAEKNGGVRKPRAKKAAAKSPAKEVAAKPSSWKDLRGKALADHLLANKTLSDSTWASVRQELDLGDRLEKESREAFIRRVLLGETA